MCFTDFGMIHLVKICIGGLVLGSSQFLVLPQLHPKNEAPFESGHKWLKNNRLDFVKMKRLGKEGYLQINIVIKNTPIKYSLTRL